MDELLKHLETAFKLISAIPVKGDDVEVMASAKNNLRTAYALAKAENKQEGDADGDCTC